MGLCPKRKVSGSRNARYRFSAFPFVAILMRFSDDLLHSLPAERAFPISQSYVDIILRGCLSISRDFARRFLETTHGWEHGECLDQNTKDNTNAGGEFGDSTLSRYIWVNDRHAPIYYRADFEYSLVKGKEIDELIQEHRPHALKLRVLTI